MIYFVCRHPRYRPWVESNFPGNSALGRCQEATDKMVEAFPELRQARGFAWTTHFGKQQHWWCVTESGEVVDPTAHQWSGGVIEYEEVADDHPAVLYPERKCPNCGDYFLQDPEAHKAGMGLCCDADCARDYAEYLNG